MFRTNNLALASYLVYDGYPLRTIEGPPGRRIFVFREDIAPEILNGFHSSREKHLLDVHRSLKTAVMAV